MFSPGAGAARGRWLPATVSSVAGLALVLVLTPADSVLAPAPAPAPIGTERYIALTRTAKDAVEELTASVRPSAFGGVGWVSSNHVVVMLTPRPPLVPVNRAIAHARATGVVVTVRPAVHSLAELQRLSEEVLRAAPLEVRPHLTAAQVDVLANRVLIGLDVVTPAYRRLLGVAFPDLVAVAQLDPVRLN